MVLVVITEVLTKKCDRDYKIVLMEKFNLKYNLDLWLPGSLRKWQ